MIFSLHISLLTSILLCVGLLAGCVYVVWQCVRAARLKRFVEVDEVQRAYVDVLPPVSIIVDACTETGQLSRFLPLVLGQDYPEFEVVVVASTEAEATSDALSALKVEHPNLHITFAPRGSRTLSRKKLALMIGIKAYSDPAVFMIVFDRVFDKVSDKRSNLDFIDLGNDLSLGLKCHIDILFSCYGSEPL